MLGKRAQRYHGTAKRVRLGLRTGMPLLTGNWHSPPAAFFLQAHIIALISLSPAHQGGSPPVPTPSPLADTSRPPPRAPHNATGKEAAAGTPPQFSTRQHRGVAAGAEEGGPEASRCFPPWCGQKSAAAQVAALQNSYEGGREGDRAWKGLLLGGRAREGVTRGEGRG